MLLRFCVNVLRGSCSLKRAIPTDCAIHCLIDLVLLLCVSVCVRAGVYVCACVFPAYFYVCQSWPTSAGTTLWLGDCDNVYRVCIGVAMKDQQKATSVLHRKTT